jgi:hypothetical protein
MFDRSLQTLSTAARRSSARHVVALLTCVLFALAGCSPTGHVDAAMKHPLPNAGAASVPADARFDLLRNQAASGDEFSNRALSNALLDKFDLTGDSDDLYEAMLWVDRRWDMYGNQELAARVVDRYCGHRVVRWHWFCVLGE